MCPRWVPTEVSETQNKGRVGVAEGIRERFQTKPERRLEPGSRRTKATAMGSAWLKV